MSTHLDPVIQEKLNAFAARRRRLIITRGIFAALAMLLMTMLIIAAIDLQVRMPDWLRWTLSGTAYFAVLVIAWRQCLTWLLHAPDSRQLARLIEHAEPKLREDLLSAVELGQTKGEVFDSEQFRALLQHDVAGRMERMEVSRLLPVSLVRRYIGYAVVVLCIVGAMVAATGWQFPTLLLRALWPSANLDRISRTKVMVVEPEGGNKLVPQGDTVRVLVVLGGERANKAGIITETAKDGWQSVDMEPLGGDRFAATINVGRESVRYRIEAGDAVTRYYLLDARERPFITSFEKTYHYPKYSKLPDRTVTETDGSIVGLDGTEVDLVLKPNQQMKTAELRLEQGKKSSTIPLVKTADGRLSARVPLNASGTYRVHLVSAETGFENKFSPENEMRAEPDLVPTVELESPKTDLILPNNEMLDLVGSASDDLGLARIAQMVKVNDGPWHETVIQKDGLGQKARIDHRWDLYDQKAKPGDLLVTKLVAVDLKGNRGESRPLQITVAAAGFELRRLQALDSLRALNLTVQALADRADLITKTGGVVRDVFQKTEDAAERRQALVSYGTGLADIEAKFNECWATLGAALKDSPHGHSSAELVMLGRELSRLSMSSVAEARASLDFLSANPNTQGAKNLANSVNELGWSMQKRARLAAAAMEAFTTAEEIAALSENGQVVAREQQRLLELASASGDDARKWGGLVTRLRVAMTQARSLEELMEPIQKRPNSAAKDRARQVISEISKRRVKLETALLEEPSQKTLMQPVMELTRTLQQYSRDFANWHRELGYKPVEMIEQILQDVGPTYGNVAKVQEDIQSVKVRGAGDEAMIAAITEQRWTSRGAVIKAHGDLEELRPNADNQFVGDLRMATVALEAVKQLYAGGDKAMIDSRFGEMDRSLRILETGHNLLETFDGLTFLASNERWDIRNLSARTQSPRDWRWLERRLRGIPNEMAQAKAWFDQRAEAEKPVRTAFEGAQKILWNAGNLAEWRGLTQEMEQRANIERLPVSTKAEAEMIAGQVKMALDLLRPHMNEARKRLEKLSPTISELAAAIAKEQEKLKQETETQAKAEAKPEETAAKAADKTAQQKQVNEKVEALKDLIRAEANKQDILKAEEREAMRDADDALAMLKDPPPKAEEALQDAVKDTGAQQKADLERAAEQQAKLQTALEQIAKHYDAAEKGKDLAETRNALREAEKELGIKQELDEKIAHAQTLAEMAQKDPTALLKELEAKLPDNPLMQKELSDISKDALANAEQKLDQAAKQEGKVAADLAAQAKDPQAKNPAETAAQAAKQAQEAAQTAHEAAKAAEKSADAAKNEAAEKLADNAAEAAKDAAKEAGKAAEAAEKMAATSNPAEAAQSAQRAAEKAAKAAEKANEAAALAQQAQAASKQGEQNGGEKQADNAEAAKQSGEATAQAKKAAEAAQKAAALAQQAAQNQQATAQNSQNPQSQQASKAAEQAAQSAEKAAQAAQAAQKAAESAEAQANNAGNQDAAKQADNAGNEAAQAAQAAQQAAAMAKEAAASGEPQKAAQAAENAAQKAGEAAQAAEKAAGAAEQAQNNSQQAAQNGGEKQGENQQAAQQSGEAKQQAQAAAQAAKQAQAQAQQAANAAKAAAAQQNQQIAQAAQQQQAIAQNAQEAGQDVARAGRHEMRLGNQSGEQLAQLGGEIQETAQNEVPAAQKALENAAKAADGNAAVQNAAGELGSELAQLKSAQQGSPQPQQGEPQSGQPQAGQPPAGQPQAGQPQGGEPQSGQPSSPAEQQAMARALDALDQQLNGQSQSPSAGQQASQPGQSQPGQSQPGEQGQPSSEQGQQPGSPSAAQSALAQAAQAAQASMRQSRAQQGMAQTPGSLVSQSQSEKSEGGAQANAAGLDYKLSTNTAGLKKGDWGKLPKKLADQLTKGQQEAIAGDYRQAVETYYKVIAEKAKDQKK
jgi:hypothetical protein